MSLILHFQARLTRIYRVNYTHASVLYVWIAQYFDTGAARLLPASTTALCMLGISVRQTYREKKSALSAAKQNAYSRLPPVAERFSPSQKPYPEFSALPISLSYDFYNDLVSEPQKKAQGFASNFT